MLVKAETLADDNWSVLEHVRLDFNPTFTQDMAIVRITYDVE